MESLITTGELNGVKLGASREELLAKWSDIKFSEKFQNGIEIIRTDQFEAHVQELRVIYLEFLVWMRGVEARLMGELITRDTTIAEFLKILDANEISWFVFQPLCLDTQIAIRVHPWKTVAIFDLAMPSFGKLYLDRN